MKRQEGFVRVKEAAAILGVSPNTVRAWGAAGRIPEYRHPINSYRLYKRGELEAINRRLNSPKSSRQQGGSLGMN